MDATTASVLKRPVRQWSNVDGNVWISDSVQYVPFGAVRLTDSIALHAGRSVAIARSGGLGDILMLTPTIRFLKQNFPHLDIDLFTSPAYIPLLEDNQFLHSVKPMDTYCVLAYDVAVDLNQFVERSPDAQRIDRVSLFTAAFGLKLDDGLPDYTVRPEELEWAKAWLEDHDIKGEWVAIAPLATDHRRSWAPEHVCTFKDMLLNMGELTPVFFHNNLEEIESYVGGLDGCRVVITESLRQKAALLSMAKFVLSTDTGIYHLAAAARGSNPLPFLVIIFSTISPNLRARWYKNKITFIADTVPCCPCHEDPSVYLSCSRQCMKAITPDIVMSHIKMFL